MLGSPTFTTVTDYMEFGSNTKPHKGRESKLESSNNRKPEPPTAGGIMGAGDSTKA